MKTGWIALLILMMSHTVYKQPDCRSVREGKFVLEDDHSGNTYITRTGDIQREENEKLGVITEDKIEWINGCTYRLIPYRILRNDSDIDFSVDLQLEIEILEVKKDSYIQRTTSRIGGVSITKEIKILNDKHGSHK